MLSTSALDSMRALQVGARSDLGDAREGGLAEGPSASFGSGGAGAPGVVELSSAAAPAASGGAGAKPEGAATPPPKRSLWRALSSGFTNKTGAGDGSRATRAPGEAGKDGPAAAFAAGAGAPGTVSLGSAAPPAQATKPPAQAKKPPVQETKAPARSAEAGSPPKRPGLWGSFSKKSQEVHAYVEAFFLKQVPLRNHPACGYLLAQPNMSHGVPTCSCLTHQFLKVLYVCLWDARQLRKGHGRLRFVFGHY